MKYVNKFRGDSANSAKTSRYGFRWSLVLGAVVAISLCTLERAEAAICVGWVNKPAAIIVANWDYKTLPELPNAKNDADIVAAALEKKGFPIKRLDNGSLSQINDFIEKTLAELKKAAGTACNEGTIVFYYAGHGISYRGRPTAFPADFPRRMELRVPEDPVTYRFPVPNDVLGFADVASKVGWQAQYTYLI